MGEWKTERENRAFGANTTVLDILKLPKCLHSLAFLFFFSPLLDYIKRTKKYICTLINELYPIC